MIESEGARRSDVSEVNVTGFSSSGGSSLAKAECYETTESSSSFGDTSTDSENGDDLNNSEVVSGCHPFVNHYKQKRKLTPHWRSFIRPVMWRCRWLQLQIMKCDALARKYYTKLEEYNKKKHVLLENIETGGLGTKPFPFPSDRPSGRVLRRKRRRKVEEDMSNHNFFSYFEKRIHTANGTYAVEGQSNQGHFNGNDESELHEEEFGLGSGDSDNSVEEMFRKIEKLESQIIELKFRLNKVETENPGKFSSVDDFDLHTSSNGLTSSARSFGSPANDIDRILVGSSDIASQLILQYRRDNTVMRESAVSSYGDVSHLPDMIERSNPSYLGGGTCRNIEDDVLIYNGRMDVEMNNLDDMTIRHVEEEPQAEASAASTDRTFPTISMEQELPSDEQPPLKIRSISKLTAPKRKKRGKRKK